MTNLFYSTYGTVPDSALCSACNLNFHETVRNDMKLCYPCASGWDKYEADNHEI